ncbi:MAG: chemotaxis protein CheR [Cupriavidus sp.]|jgi:chemotaxis protein methyltransferase CheR|uniref:CheR family methyltransferase n=1 Tax=Cupriavidus pauculus TaxID=82633 RepID=UPI000785FF89|nr:CheR family methyltransferase [Cupriavidus pauculus]MBU67111.1 chemotaxis protein CheR [Cupriavidus sp.]KAB0598008.1 chemotaxis protein CheR [Cupriavidus pauculus]MBY4731125.1 chemotaxis protein CheR [Cupriavidus pauculus]MCM3607246.1 chemotaxis protein CheR [Cupriavidus pauculus]UAL01881.1 chemotaxis protein CheR [Cupriavidus pauculus]
MTPLRSSSSAIGKPGAAANQAAPVLAPLRDDMRDFLLTERDFEKVRALIHKRAGISLGSHKREMVYSRLARRLRALGISDFGTYLSLLEADDHSDEWEYFTNALTTNLTSFFREAHHFPLLAEHAKKVGRPYSVWCAAASTGEEPYSIAITLAEALGERAATVLATDIDTQVLAKARAGVYSAEQVSRLSQERLKRFFLKGTGARAGSVKVKPELAATISFETLNLLAPDWGIREKFDAIFCRNVMIYFDKPTQGRILERFAPLLKPNGLLFAGHSENFSYVTRAFQLRGQTVYELAGKGGA